MIKNDDRKINENKNIFFHSHSHHFPNLSFYLFIWSWKLNPQEKQMKLASKFPTTFVRYLPLIFYGKSQIHFQAHSTKLIGKIYQITFMSITIFFPFK